MTFIKGFLLSTLLMIFAAACAPRTFDPASTSGPNLEEQSVNPAEVDSEEVRIVENSPLQVNPVILGQLSGDSEQSLELITRDISKFQQQLLDALNERDSDLLELLMEESFTIAVWQSEGKTYSINEAVKELQLKYLGGTSTISSDPDFDMNSPIYNLDMKTFFGPESNPEASVLVSGWGMDGQDEAILIISSLPDGSLNWQGVLVAKGGFIIKAGEPSIASNIPVGVQSALYDTQAGMVEDVTHKQGARRTNVQYVMAQQDLLIFTSPGMQYSSAGMAVTGQIIRVTGMSNGSNWWQVECPDETTDNCWVSAHPSYTQPVQPPG